MQVFENLNYRYVDTGSKRMSLLKIKFNRGKLYWLCQVTGWAVLVILNLLVISSHEDLSSKRVLAGLFFAFTGIGATHIFRGIIKTKNWLELPLRKIIPRVIFSSLLLGTIIYSLVYLFRHFSGTLHSEDYTVITLVIGIVNMSGISLFWSLIYFAIHYLENYQKTEIESLIWEAAVKDYELKTLKSQLNPHFMFMR